MQASLFKPEVLLGTAGGPDVTWVFGRDSPESFGYVSARRLTRRHARRGAGQARLPRQRAPGWGRCEAGRKAALSGSGAWPAIISSPRARGGAFCSIGDRIR